MSEPGYHDALRVLCDDAGVDLHRVLMAACGPLPAWDPVVYLADFAFQALYPLAAEADGQDVAGTMAGRAFITGQPVTSPRDGSVRVWVPVVEQTTRTGVLAVTVPDASAQLLAQVESLGVFAGLVVAAAVRVSDVPFVRRRGRAMSLAAGMQWDLLPPLSARTAGGLIAGVLEPAYDIAGDAFDYAVNGSDLHFAIIDGLGHGIGSTLLTGLAVGAYRHARRDGATLAGMHAAIEAALAEYYDDYSFATGIIARLATGSGRLEWSCAGHPRPLLLRDRKVVAELSSAPVLPFGLGDPAPEPGIEQLQPDDVVLLYTDGVTEARTPQGNSSGWTGWPICWSGKPPAAGQPKNCYGAWSSPCSAIRPAICAMTPRCCWCSGPVCDRNDLSQWPGRARDPACSHRSVYPDRTIRYPATASAAQPWQKSDQAILLSCTIDDQE